MRFKGTSCAGPLEHLPRRGPGPGWCQGWSHQAGTRCHPGVAFPCSVPPVPGRGHRGWFSLRCRCGGTRRLLVTQTRVKKSRSGPGSTWELFLPHLLCPTAPGATSGTAQGGLHIPGMGLEHPEKALDPRQCLSQRQMGHDGLGDPPAGPWGPSSRASGTSRVWMRGWIP